MLFKWVLVGPSLNLLGSMRDKTKTSQQRTIRDNEKPQTKMTLHIYKLTGLLLLLLILFLLLLIVLLLFSLLRRES